MAIFMLPSMAHLFIDFEQKKKNLSRFQSSWAALLSSFYPPNKTNCWLFLIVLPIGKKIILMYWKLLNNTHNTVITFTYGSLHLFSLDNWSTPRKHCNRTSALLVTTLYMFHKLNPIHPTDLIISNNTYLYILFSHLYFILFYFACLQVTIWRMVVTTIITILIILCLHMYLYIVTVKLFNFLYCIYSIYQCSIV